VQLLRYITGRCRRPRTSPAIVCRWCPRRCVVHVHATTRGRREVSIGSAVLAMCVRRLAVGARFRSVVLLSARRRLQRRLRRRRLTQRRQYDQRCSLLLRQDPNAGNSRVGRRLQEKTLPSFKPSNSADHISQEQQEEQKTKLRSIQRRLRYAMSLLASSNSNRPSI